MQMNYININIIIIYKCNLHLKLKWKQILIVLMKMLFNSFVWNHVLDQFWFIHHRRSSRVHCIVGYNVPVSIGVGQGSSNLSLLQSLAPDQSHLSVIV